MATTDGGQNWESVVSIPQTFLYSITFTDAQNGWSCGSDGLMLHTTDGGANWITQTTSTDKILRYGVLPE